MPTMPTIDTIPNAASNAASDAVTDTVTLRVDPANPLRPTGGPEVELWDTAAQVPDPEIPVISIAELGILRGVHFAAGRATVTITPTYSGCPAMDRITADLREVLLDRGYEDPRVELVLQPAWSTDWITETGRGQLRGYGIAPPARRTGSGDRGVVKLTLARPEPVACPQCRSVNTKTLSHFGSTSCKSLHQCLDCREPFDYFKVH